MSNVRRQIAMRSYPIVLILAFAQNALASCPEKAVSLSELESKGIVYSSRLRIQDIERREAVTIQTANGTKRTLPFGYSNQNWKALRFRMKSGDYIASFSEKSEPHNPLSGTKGYMLVRGSCVIESFLTFIS